MLDCRPLAEPPRRAVQGGDTRRRAALHGRQKDLYRGAHQQCPSRRRPSSLPHPGAPAVASRVRTGRRPSPPKRARPKVKKLRLAFLLLGLGVLALISTVFGMLMAVASDLPALENKAEYAAARNSVLYADLPGCKESDTEQVHQVARLTGNQNRILLTEDQISPNIKNAVIAIEDRRFYQHGGVDYKGIARAFCQDLLRRSAAQGGSTITQQFVKNALSAQGNRSVFQKLREAALAYHLERKWSKEKILTQYLNTVYFGNGAYGIESAVRAYFGRRRSSRTARTGYSDADQARRRDAGGGGAAGRDDRLALAATTRCRTRAGATRGATSCCSTCWTQQHDHARASTRRPYIKVPPEAEHQPARARLLAALLLELADPAARRPLRAGRGVRRRPEDQDHASTPSCSGGGAGDRRPAGRLRARAPRSWRSTTAPARSRRWSAATTTSTTPSTSPPTATASRARPSSRSRSSRALADGREPGQHLAVRSRRPSTWQARARSPSTTTTTTTRASSSLRTATANSDNSVFARARRQGGDAQDRPPGPPDGRAHEGLHQPGDDARRPEGGRHAARDGLRLLHDRQQGRAQSGSLAPDGDGPVGIERVKGRGQRRQEQDHLASASSRSGAGETAQELLEPA